MYMVPMSVPNTMMPATAATQKIRRLAMSRSYSGLLARRCRMMNSPAATTVSTPNSKAAVCPSGMGAKLIASTSPAIIKIDRIPPALSTGSVVSLTCAGIRRRASTNATTASGTVMRNTDPHQ